MKLLSYLITCRHTDHETCFIIPFAEADSLRPFMHIEVSSDSMTGPVIVVEAAPPQWLPTNTVES